MFADTQLERIAGALERIAAVVELERTPPLKVTLHRYIRSGPHSSMVRDILTLLADMPECMLVRDVLLDGVEMLAGT